MNSVTMMGRLSQEPEIRYQADGKPVFNFNFAVGRRFVRTDGPKADFFRCVAFGSTAERLQKCQIGKGVKLLIQGELQNSSYTDKNGQQRTQTQIIVNDFEFCEKKEAQEGGQAPQRAQTATKPPRAAQTPEGFMDMDPGIDAQLPFY